MSFFDRIANLISEKPKNDATDGHEKKISPLNAKNECIQDEKTPNYSVSPATPAKESAVVEGKKTEVPLESREELLKRVCDLVAILFDNVEMNVGKRLVIWLDADQLTFQAYDTESYRQRFLAALLNECDMKFDAVSFSLGKPEESLRPTPVGKSGKVFLQIVDEQPVRTSVSCKASISIFGNAGSLLKNKYILSSDEMREKKITAYNIGAGEFPQVPTGYRENHIAIDDNPNGPMIEKNKFVSRMHAHIGYSDTLGFYLQVERDGTRLMGKRTRIFRGKQIIEMENPMVKEALQDGDLIELGKAVVLRYMQHLNESENQQ